MAKLTQNKVAESKLPMPAALALGTLLWLLCGLVTNDWWIQYAAFAITALLMVELNNQHALIRVYSRMVSCAFILLFCAANFLMPSVRGAIMQAFVVAAYLVLFHSYQDKTATASTYYAFLLLGLASLAEVHILYFVPLIWLLMTTNLLCMSWRNWGASILGLLTPYWFATAWLALSANLTPLTDHVAKLAQFTFPVNYARLTVGFMLVIGLLITLTVTGIIHYLRKSYNDKIRIRMLFGFFIWTDLVALAFICVQPRYQDMLLRIIIINTAPLVAHFLTLTSTRVTNAAFYAISIATLAIIGYNVWTSTTLF